MTSMSPELCVAELEAKATRRVTPCGDGDMVWRLWGDGPPLVLLHGGHGSWTHWIRNIAVLSQRYRLLVPDLPGYGESATPPEPHTAESLGAVLSRGLDLMLPQPARYAMVGFSLGGIIGGCAAALQRDRLRSLVIIGSSGLGLPSVGITGLMKWTPDMPRAQLRDIHRHNLATIMISNPDRIDDLALYLQMENTLKARIKGSAIARSDALARALPAVRGRLMCLSGRQDVYVASNLEQRKALFRAVQADTPFRDIDGAGHWVMFEAADAFNQTLLSLLDEATAAQDGQEWTA